jgi:hypothetical protein
MAHQPTEHGAQRSQLHACVVDVRLGGGDMDLVHRKVTGRLGPRIQVLGQLEGLPSVPRKGRFSFTSALGHYTPQDPSRMTCGAPLSALRTPPPPPPFQGPLPPPPPHSHTHSETHTPFTRCKPDQSTPLRPHNNTCRASHLSNVLLAVQGGEPTMQSLKLPHTHGSSEHLVG